MHSITAWLGAVIVSVLAAVSLDQTVIPILIAVLSSGFIFGLFKIMPERRSILVQASENAVKVVNEAIGTLQKELTDARLEIARLEGELSSSKEQRYKLQDEIMELRGKVTRLETQLELYQKISGEAHRATEARYASDEARHAREHPAVPDPPYSD